MVPLDVACPTCARQPGEACDWAVLQEATELNATNSFYTAGIFHAARIEAAAVMSSGAIGEPPGAEVFAKAVEASGLV